MDPLLVMLGSLMCTLMGLVFVEVRRIRKRLEKRVSEAASVTTATTAASV
jgi:hypothetical protein